MANRKVNAVIVGSGAGGGVVAKELAEAGMSVVLLERGKHYTMADFNHDELKSQYSVPPAYGPSVFANPRTFRYTDREKARIVYPGVDDIYGKTDAAVGGGTLAYGAACWRYKCEDFRMKSTYGTIVGSSLEDWPISYDDLEPYYEKIEYVLGVSGLAGADPFAEPRKKPYPVPPLPINPTGEIVRDAGRRLGWHPFPPPFAILTAPYHGRIACVQCSWCLAYICEVGAKSGTEMTVIPAAIKTGHCQLHDQCFVTRILTDEKGRATGVQYFDREKRGHELYADLVVVACSATETPRLLLNSASRLHPRGLGNSSDQVGRNLNDHTGADAFGIFEQEIPHEKGPGPSIAFNDWNHPRGGEVIGGGYIYNYYCTLPIEFAGNRPPEEPRWGKQHKEFQRCWFRHFIHLGSNCQAMPQERNRVDLDPRIRDAWGTPVARITHSWLPLDLVIANFVMDKEEMLLKEAGAIRTWRGRNGRGGVGDHQNGSCRMGNDPKASVVNAFSQSHDVDNLFITDGSVMVTDGGFNPSLTIQALAGRTADYITKQWKGGAWRGGKPS
ncbi:MAG TPA: GMC family oxidoreductase [Terriglobia bacterium]|nr:GMC family oxidoreductase [Terriglobia bacterium]